VGEIVRGGVAADAGEAGGEGRGLGLEGVELEEDDVAEGGAGAVGVERDEEGARVHGGKGKARARGSKRGVERAGAPPLSRPLRTIRR
jgi:hypothetical protein